MGNFDLKKMGEKIKSHRKALGWSQEALAKKVGYADKSMISRIENGTVDLSQSQLLKFAEIFGIEAGSLLNVDSDSYYADPKTAQLAQDLFDRPGMRVLFDAARDSRPEDLQMAAELLERLKRTNPDG